MHLRRHRMTGTNLLENGANKLWSRSSAVNRVRLIWVSRGGPTIANRSQSSMTPVATLTVGLPRPRAPSGYVPPRNASTGSNELARQDG